MIIKPEPESSWDVHKHRDELSVSEHNTIYHLQKGQLGVWEHHYNCELFMPIMFTSKTQAYEWIKNGCISDIQAELQDLKVGFSRECFKDVS